jgi:hypothetical protein
MATGDILFNRNYNLCYLLLPLYIAISVQNGWLAGTELNIIYSNTTHWTTSSPYLPTNVSRNQLFSMLVPTLLLNSLLRKPSTRLFPYHESTTIIIYNCVLNSCIVTIGSVQIILLYCQGKFLIIYKLLPLNYFHNIF